MRSAAYILFSAYFGLYVSFHTLKRPGVIKLKKKAAPPGWWRLVFPSDPLERRCVLAVTFVRMLLMPVSPYPACMMPVLDFCLCGRTTPTLHLLPVLARDPGPATAHRHCAAQSSAVGGRPSVKPAVSVCDTASKRDAIGTEFGAYPPTAETCISM